MKEFGRKPYLASGMTYLEMMKAIPESAIANEGGMFQRASWKKPYNTEGVNNEEMMHYFDSSQRKLTGNYIPVAGDPYFVQRVEFPEITPPPVPIVIARAGIYYSIDGITWIPFSTYNFFGSSVVVSNTISAYNANPGSGEVSYSDYETVTPDWNRDTPIDIHFKTHIVSVLESDDKIIELYFISESLALLTLAHYFGDYEGEAAEVTRVIGGINYLSSEDYEVILPIGTTDVWFRVVTSAT
jgi:hypothetical protein